jgi:UDP-2-acetamido-3-amino-2,3-dideoxy-glucuronate N-acetyltransferase
MTGFFAHPSAVLDPGVTIGAGTKIWHHSHVASGAEIGQNCSLGQNVYVAPRVKIGNGVRIQNNVSIYEGVTLEDEVFCGPSMVFTNVERPRAAFPVGSDAYRTTHVARGASIGANATIVCGITVGSWAMIGAGSVVTRDVAAYGLALGVPARHAGWVCRCSADLHFESAFALCAECRRGYQLGADGRVEFVQP